MRSQAFKRCSLLTLPRLDEAHFPDGAATPDIARRQGAKTVVGMSVLSGMLSTVAAWQVSESYVFYLGPGVFFGILVLLPWCRFCRISWPQTLTAVALAPIGYLTAAHLTLAGNIYSLTASLLGCVIMFCPIFLRCHPRIRYALIVAVGVGWLIGVMLVVPYLALLGGIAAWQVAVAYCMSTALHVEDAP